jgi:predicted nucleic acid-binding Zn ribbon protein
MAGVLTQHTHCGHCGKPMPWARFGQVYCSALCRTLGRAEEQRAAQALWRAAGKPREVEVAAMGEAAR